MTGGTALPWALLGTLACSSSGAAGPETRPTNPHDLTTSAPAPPAENDATEPPSPSNGPASESPAPEAESQLSGDEPHEIPDTCKGSSFDLDEALGYKECEIYVDAPVPAPESVIEGSIEPTYPVVRRGASISLTVRTKNRSSAPVSVDVYEACRAEAFSNVVVFDDGGRRVDKLSDCPGPPLFCVPRILRFELAPGGSITKKLVFLARVPPTCGAETVPMLPQNYRIQVMLPVMEGPSPGLPNGAWRTASTTLVVR